jgi:hypothetical protein
MKETEDDVSMEEEAQSFFGKPREGERNREEETLASSPRRAFPSLHSGWSADCASHFNRYSYKPSKVYDEAAEEMLLLGNLSHVIVKVDPCPGRLSTLIQPP